LIFGGFIFIVVGIIATTVMFAWYAKDLPRPDKIRRTSGLSTVILDRNGENLYDIFQEADRIPATWDELPQYLKDATIAIEDKDFYRHQGLSTTGIMRGLVACFVFRRCQGGSTLTQQLVKNVLLSQERTLPRKMKEAVLAIQIERKYSKNDILLMYLNEAPYGGTAVGVKAAAEDYFNKDVKELNLVESVILAGLPQAPSRYSPFTGEDLAYVPRATDVLRRMREDGFITPTQEEQARKALPEMVFAEHSSELRAPHFVSYVRDALEDQFGQERVDNGGLVVTTTLDWELQEKAQRAVKEEVDKAKKLDVSNGAAVVMDPNTGEIYAMVGSKDYTATDSSGLKYNVAVQALRQPGSLLKPIIYAAALLKGYTASQVWMDVETKYPSGSDEPEYNPKNYDSKYRGPVQMRQALGNSVNTIAVKATAVVGVKDVLKLGHDMGLTTWEPTADLIQRVGLSLALGGAEVHMLDGAVAYSVFANGGKRVTPRAIQKVTDTQGKILYEYKQVNMPQVLDFGIAYIISSILSDNDARQPIFGPNSYLHIPGRTVAAKTGTTDDKRDNWTAGYTKERVVIVWVGNNDNTPMHPTLASGVTGAAPIWNRIMKAAIADLPNFSFEQPSHVLEMEIDAYGGGIPVDGQQKRKEFFIRGTEPTGPASIYQVLKISRHDESKRANDVEIATGDYEEKRFIVFREDDPVSSDGKNRWQEGIDAWINAQGDNGKFKPPTESYSGTNQVVLTISTPSDKSEVANDVEIKGKVLTTADVRKVEFFVDGDKKKEVSDREFSVTLSIPNGQHVIRVRVEDSRGQAADREIKVGVHEPYAETTPTPTVTPSPTPH